MSYVRSRARRVLKTQIGGNKIKRLWARNQSEKMQKILKALIKAFKDSPSKVLKFRIKRVKMYLAWRVKYS